MDPETAREPAPENPAPPKGRGLITLAVKATVTVTLITWLVRSGSLDLEKLRILVDSPRVLVTTVCTWLVIAVVMATWRWRILLRSVGAEVALVRAVALQVTALFFNGLVPGNVGGDFIKNQAVLGNQPAKLVVLVFVERAVGLVSLIWAGGVGVLLSAGAVQKHRELLPIASAVLLLMTGSVVAPWILFRLLRPRASEALRATSSAGLVGLMRRGLKSASGALQLIFEEKETVIKGLVLSFGMHLCNIGYFLFLTRELGNPEAAYSEVAMIFPLGLLTLVLPISISGFGVGHMMFNELFRLLGLQGGATIFNVFIVAQLSLCLLGAIPYLFMRHNRPLAAEGASASSARSSAEAPKE
jgi:uncharacterized protein (TIRG00374 family)